MPNLTSKQYWDDVHAAQGEYLRAQDASAAEARPLRSLAALRRKLSDYTRNYDDYLLWEVIYPRYLPGPGSKVVEIGSAPGDHLVRLAQTFGLVPYGIEYSEVGVELNRRLFMSTDINPDNVIHADFFSPELHDRYRGFFDVVVSHGFIEHFTDVQDVVEKHLNLLKEGGLLIVGIPNLLGVNRLLCCLFHRELIAMHNLRIMTKREFSRLFKHERVRTLFCDYLGTFSFWIFSTKKDSPMRFVLAACSRVQPVLNMVFRLCLKGRGAETRLLSPYLTFIGVKQG